MGKNRLRLSRSIPLVIVTQIMFALYGCSSLGIVLLSDPLSAEEHNDLGCVYESKGLLDLAEKEYKMAKRKRGDWFVPYFNLGNIEFKKGNYKKAELLYREALSLDPKNSDIMNNLALSLLHQKRINEAEEMIRRALSFAVKEHYLDTLQEIESALIKKE